MNVDPQMFIHLGLSGVFALPLLLALGLLIRPVRGIALVLAPWGALPALVLALGGLGDHVLELPWLMLGTRLGLDDTARVFLFFSALLWLCAGIYARAYLGGETRSRQASFFAFYLLAMAGNLGLIVALDLAGFFFFYALMSFSSYGLVVHTRDEDALRAGRVYIALVVIGEVVLFSAIALMVTAGNAGLPNLDAAPDDALIALVLIGFGIKAGALGLHVWLPLAHPAAPVPASAVLSGAMIKAGLLGWLRFLPLGVVALPGWGLACVVAGFAAAFYGVAVGLVQRNPKTVLAYSSISQMGLMSVLLGLGLSHPEGWPLIGTALLVYAVHHALAKAALFLSVGVAAHGLMRRPWGMGVVLIPALAMAGLPLTGGAVAKTALKGALSAAALPWTEAALALLPVSALGTTLLLARFLVVLREAEAVHHHKTPGLYPPWLVLIATSLVLFWMWPQARDLALVSLQPDKLLAALWPLVLGGVTAWAVWRMAPRYAFLQRLRIPAGDVLVVFERLAPLGRWFIEDERWVGLRRGLLSGVRVARWGDALRFVFNAGSGVELRLRQWPVAGALFVSLLVLIVLLLAVF